MRLHVAVNTGAMFAEGTRSQIIILSGYVVRKIFITLLIGIMTQVLALLALLLRNNNVNTLQSSV